jgi:hypothetical protein
MTILKSNDQSTVLINSVSLNDSSYLLLVVGLVLGVLEAPRPIRLSSSPDVGSNVSGGQLNVGIASSANG